MKIILGVIFAVAAFLAVTAAIYAMAPYAAALIVGVGAIALILNQEKKAEEKSKENPNGSNAEFRNGATRQKDE